MTFYDSELRTYAPALQFDEMLSAHLRRRVLLFLAGLAAILFFAILGTVFYTAYRTGSYTLESLTTLPPVAVPIAGVLLMVIALYGTFLTLTFFYNTLYFRGLTSIVKEELTDEHGITYEVARVFHASNGDLTRGFFTSVYGRVLALRLGISPHDLALFLQAPRIPLRFEIVPMREQGFLTLRDVGSHLYTADTQLSEYLFKRGVTPEHFSGALEWVSRELWAEKYALRWWSRDALGKFKGIGSAFSFGVAYELKRYARSIRTSGVFSLMQHQSAYAGEVIERIEAALSRTKSANVMLVCEPGMGEMDILLGLKKKMADGKAASSIVGKEFVVFDDDVFVATHNDKEAFELGFMKLMSETVSAGNIIMILERLHAFITSVEALQVDLADIWDRFLASTDVQFICTVDPSSYHDVIETRPQLLKHFETILIEKPDIGSSIRVLEDALPGLESRHHVYFSYPAVARVAESAERYIVEGVMPDKALSLLAEIAALAEGKRMTIVGMPFVDECVSMKTGVALGPVKDDERELLKSLETRLHERVVGQDDALRAIASALRRSRAGIQDAERPVGSFLFLGSTGVGKTETAKALASLFFGGEDRMIRFDMSEYSDESGLGRLIGTRKETGALSAALEERPFGVLLLDEFEKGSKEVHDLFLQILDEGMFTDGRGKRINARNLIIIATSNAGSQLIYTFIQEGKKPADARDTIIDTIVQEHILKPELINRFDSVVIFESLSESHQEKIARLMLHDLVSRIKKSGYNLTFDNSLVAVLMKEGYDPEFGARPMRRAIQDLIEERIAMKIIEGGLKLGDTVTLTAEDFPNTKAGE